MKSKHRMDPRNERLNGAKRQRGKLQAASRRRVVRESEAGPSQGTVFESARNTKIGGRGQINSAQGHSLIFNFSNDPILGSGPNNDDDNVGLGDNLRPYSPNAFSAGSLGDRRSPQLNPSRDNGWDSRPIWNLPPLPVKRSCDIYYQHLAVKGRGSPLWQTEPSSTLPVAYRRRGIAIGDVGIITAFGGFDFMFNICLPFDHPINMGGLPEDFEPVLPQLHPSDIHRHRDYKPNSYLASESVVKSHRENDSSEIEFESSASEGAILTMPQGAHGEHLGNVSHFRQYFSANVERWYRYVNNIRGREARNGDVRLVIGCDKASSWGMATFANSTAQDFHLKFKPTGDGGSGLRPTYVWEYSGVVEARSGPEPEDIEELRLGDDPGHSGVYSNQCLFVRTLNGTVRDDVWRALGFKFGTSMDVQFDSNPNTYIPSSNSGPSSGLPNSTAPSYFNSTIGTGSSTLHIADFNTALPAHPSKAMNSFMLTTNPHAKIAITDDLDWTSLINKSDRRLPPLGELINRMLSTCDVCESDSVVFLKLKQKASSRSSVQPLPPRSMTQATPSGGLQMSPKGNETSIHGEIQDADTINKFWRDSSNVSQARKLSGPSSKSMQPAVSHSPPRSDSEFIRDSPPYSDQSLRASFTELNLSTNSGPARNTLSVSPPPPTDPPPVNTFSPPPPDFPVHYNCPLNSPRCSGENAPSVLSSTPRPTNSPGARSVTSLVAPHLQPPPFVFPGSRSTARPTKESQPLHSAPPSTENRSHINASPRFKDTIPYLEKLALFSQPRSVSLLSPSDTSFDDFVLPGGRSRARPKVAPQASKDQQSSRVSGTDDDGKREEKRSKFWGFRLKKKKAKPQKLIGGLPPVSEVVSEQADPWLENDPVHAPDSYPLRQITTPQESLVQANLVKSRIGEYPLDPYHSVLLDNDRHTGELLARLNPTSSPSFHNYGNNPPSSVLDLGCGQGHWVVDAAIAWKGYGTKVTGYDMVDVSKGLLPWAVDQGVAGNIGFVRGNFLKQRLPFGNDSFDLVRMSCLSLCITSDSWLFVLQEVSRVLMVGGRLELIDDLIFFPYGKASTSSYTPGPESNSRAQSIAPRLEVTIPSATFTTFGVYDGQLEANNPGLGQGEGEEEPEGLYELYGVQEEEVEGGSAKLDEGGNVGPMPDLPRNSLAPPRRSRTSRHFKAHARSWTRGCANSGGLEALFDDMLEHKFGINKNPSEFVLGLMKEVFKYAQEIKTMHLTLAPLEMGVDGDGYGGRRQRSTDRPETFMPGGGGRFGGPSRRESTSLLRAPGLLLLPSTFIPMDQSELEIHASKHLRMLLSCKSHLLEHAIETTDHDKFDNDAVLEALWEYEGFLRRRFDPPPLSRSLGDDQGSDALSNNWGSVAESFSSNRLEAGWVTEPESRQPFVWKRSLSQDPSATPGPSTTMPVENTPTPPTFPLEYSAPGGTDPASHATPAPMYSRDERTHVRTFRIYEATKVDESIFGST